MNGSKSCKRKTALASGRAVSPWLNGFAKENICSLHRRSGNMIRNTLVGLCLGAIAVGVSGLASADDTNTDRPIITYKQKMQMCVDKERQQDTGKSDKELKKTCSAKLQSLDQHPSETKMPPANPTT
jgi:hypothetical protein